MVPTTTSIPERQIGMAVSKHQLPNFATLKFIDIILNKFLVIRLYSLFILEYVIMVR